MDTVAKSPKMVGCTNVQMVIMMQWDGPKDERRGASRAIEMRMSATLSLLSYKEGSLLEREGLDNRVDARFW